MNTTKRKCYFVKSYRKSGPVIIDGEEIRPGGIIRTEKYGDWLCPIGNYGWELTPEAALRTALKTKQTAKDRVEKSLVTLSTQIAMLEAALKKES